MTIFSAPNYCGEFDNAGAMMSVDDDLTCSFQILKPNDKKSKFSFGSRGGAKTSFPYPKVKVCVDDTFAPKINECIKNCSITICFE